MSLTRIAVIGALVAVLPTGVAVPASADPGTPNGPNDPGCMMNPADAACVGSSYLPPPPAPPDMGMGGTPGMPGHI
jgi:hypothetical protein